jgi:hypothetical protein
MLRLAILSPLRQRSFLQLWCGQLLSSIGDGIFLVALIDVMITERSSAKDLGAVLSARSLVTLATILYGGVLADRFRRTRVMAAADLVRGVAGLMVAFLSYGAPLSYWIFLAAVIGAGSGIFRPAYSVLIGTLLPPDKLEAGNALRNLTLRMAQILGPSIGAVLIVTVGAHTAFLIDAVTFFVSMLTLLGIRESREPRRTAGRNALREALEGVRAVRERPWIGTVIVSGTIQVLLVLAPMMVMLPIVLRQRGAAEAYGFLVALRSVGGVGGALLAAQSRPRLAGLAAMCGPLTLWSQLLCFLIPVPLWVFGLAMVISGFGPPFFLVYWPSALLRAVPPDLRGRVFSLDELGAFTLEPVGLALTPAVVAGVGVIASAAGAGVVLVLTSLLPLLVPGVAHFAAPQPAKGIRSDR